MNKNIFRSASLGAAVALLAALPSAARAQQFHQYVALGDSLTAGWQSGCLVQRNQVDDYPAVLASVLLGRRLRACPRAGSGGYVRQRLAAVPRRRLRAARFDQRGADVGDGRPAERAAPAALQQPRDAGRRGRGPDDPDPRRPERHRTSRSSRRCVLRNCHGLALRRHERRRRGGSAPGARRELGIATLWIGNNDVLGASTSGIVVDGVTLISQADFQRQSYSAIIAGIPPGVQLVVAQHPGRHLDPVLDDDPAGPGRSRDAPAGHRQRIRRPAARAGRRRLSRARPCPRTRAARSRRERS